MAKATKKRKPKKDKKIILIDHSGPKKDKKIILIDHSGKKSERDTRNRDPENRVLVPDGVMSGLNSLAGYRAMKRSSDGYSPEANVEYAIRLGLDEAAKWIKKHPSDYIDGITVGFITEEQLVSYKASRKIYEKYDGNLGELRNRLKNSHNKESKGRDLILGALMTYRFIHREKLIGLLIANGVSRKFESARKYLNRLLTGLRKEGYLIVKNKNHYSVKGVTEEVVKNGTSTEPEQEEEEMTKRKTKKKGTAKSKKKETAKKTSSKKTTSKEKSKKPANGIVGFVIKKLEGGEFTKRQLAQEIMKSGLSTMKDEAQIIKYLNVTFYKWRKRGMPLKKKEKPKDGGGTVGYFRLESSKK